MKKPTAKQISADPTIADRYNAYLSAKAGKNKAYRERRTKREQEALAKAKALEGNRTIDPTREEWLQRAVGLILPHLKELGYEPTGLVKTSLSIFQKKRKSITWGFCFHASASEGGYREIFINAELTDVRKILGVLVHELGHACLKDGVGHRNPFKVFCEKVGFQFEKAEHADDGILFWKWCAPIAKELGAFPHKKLLGLPEGGKKKQSTRLIKCECEDCGFVFRATRKWLEDKDALQCPDAACGGRVDFSLDNEGEDEEE